MSMIAVCNPTLKTHNLFDFVVTFYVDKSIANDMCANWQANIVKVQEAETVEEVHNALDAFFKSKTWANKIYYYGIE